eukprot:463025_1
MAHQAQPGTDVDGEGVTESMSLKVWMEQNNMTLSEKTIKILNEENIKTISDLRTITVKDMKEYAKEMKIPMGDRSKLRNAIEILSPAQEKKAIYLNTEEINMIQAMKAKIKEFKNIAININMVENNTYNQKEALINEINKQFQILSNTLLDRKKKLITELNSIINNKVTTTQTAMISYNQTLEQIENIKEQNDILMDTPISMNAINHRQIKVSKNYKDIQTIINENAQSINDQKILFHIDTNEALKFINQLGMISQSGLPVIEQLCGDNTGNIKLYWKIMTTDDVKNDEVKSDDNKICIDYFIQDNVKNNNMNWISKQFILDDNVNKGNQIIKVNKVGTYNFKMKYYVNKLWSLYSNVKTVTINTIVPDLKWNTQPNTYGHYNNTNSGKCSTRFINDNTISIYWATASVDYVIKAEDVEQFCFEFHVKSVEGNDSSLDSAFGFTKYPISTYVTNFGTSFYAQSVGVYGVYFVNTAATVYSKSKEIKKLILPNGVKYKINDKIGYKINMNKKTAELFYNGNSLGVVYENIPDAIIPVVNGNGFGGNVEISVSVTTY